MPNIRWSSAVDGLFADAAGWLGNFVPSQFDNVLLDATGPAFTVLAASDLLNNADFIVNSIQTSSNATFKVTGGNALIGDLLGVATTFTALAGTGAGANFGKILIQNGLVNNLLGALTASPANLVLNGIVNNVGAIEIAAEPSLIKFTGDARSILSVSKVLKLTGGGQVTMLTASLNNVITGTGLGSILYNINNAISGAGLLGAGRLKLINGSAGLINGDSSQVALIIDTATNTILNAGKIENTGLGGTVIKSVLDNSGILSNSQGVMTILKDVIGNGVAQITGGKMDFLSLFNQNVFFGKSGVLELAKSLDFTSIISGFSKNGATGLQLSDLSFIKGITTSFSGNSLGGILTVVDGSQIRHFNLSGDYLGVVFKAIKGLGGGTEILGSLPTASSLASQHGFVAAMSSLGAKSSGGSVSLDQHGPRLGAMLATPHAQYA